MKLQILIPQYKETDEIIKPMLDSLVVQQNVDFDDFGVIIVNDGSDVFLSDSFLSSYPYKIQYFKEEHRGVSGTRQSCLEHATAEYVMFCDADDMFYNACGLYILYREMAVEPFNGLISVFIEEGRHPKTKEPIYMNRDNDRTFVHGKVWNREYLMSNNIKWNQSLTIHEDSYFNFLAIALSDEKKMKYCQSPFYLWKWRDESVCRHDPKYILKTFNNMLDSSTALCNELKDRGKTNEAKTMCTSMIYDSYFTMNKDEWINQENQEYRISTEKRFAKYYRDFKDDFKSLPKEEKAMIVAGVKNRMFQEGLVLESITFDDWIKHIEKDY